MDKHYIGEQLQRRKDWNGNDSFHLADSPINLPLLVGK